jgi:hypothetical protein
MKLLGQEGLGRPDLEIKADLEAINKMLKEKLGEEAPEANLVLVFTDARAVLDPEGTPYPLLKPKDLKEFLRKESKAHPFRPAQIKRVTDILPTESIP